MLGLGGRALGDVLHRTRHRVGGVGHRLGEPLGLGSGGADSVSRLSYLTHEQREPSQPAIQRVTDPAESCQHVVEGLGHGGQLIAPAHRDGGGLDREARREIPVGESSECRFETGELVTSERGCGATEQGDRREGRPQDRYPRSDVNDCQGGAAER